MSDQRIDRQELVRRLRLPPRTVRTLIGTWGHLLSDPRSGRFTALDVSRLQVAMRMTQRGYSAEEIEAEMQHVASAEGGTVDECALARAEAAAAANKPGSLQEELSLLRTVLVDDVERQRIDRDRVLMALMRTQQELMVLRGELGLTRTRKERKRSIWRRLIG